MERVLSDSSHLSFPTPAPVTPTNPDYVCLFGIMRTDLASLNPGKAVAQGMHASNKMVFLLQRAVAAGDTTLKALYDEWATQAGDQGFGTTIVKQANERDMRKCVKRAEMFGIHAGIVHDPTYPLRDGGVTHLIPLDTCAYVFCRKSVGDVILEALPLMD